MGNVVFFEQIIENVVRNAEKYSAEHQTVELVASCDGPDVSISISDRGRQFDQSHVEAMFETFYRDPETATRVAGLGLGLPVCRRLAEVQGGSVRASARAGGGITVTLTLPVAPSDF